ATGWGHPLTSSSKRPDQLVSVWRKSFENLLACELAGRFTCRKHGEVNKRRHYCFSYSPLLTRFSTLKPAFFASEIESVLGELNVENTFRTGFLHAGQLVNGA